MPEMKSLPASVVLNWQGTYLLQQIKNGMWIYPQK